MKNKLDLFSTIVGSHIWRMNHEDSDLDINVCYLMDSREWILGKRPKGKQTIDGIEDYTYFELEHVIHNLMRGNCNYLWMVMTPLSPVSEYKTAFRELRQIVSTNLAKNTFKSISGLATHNIYHYITGVDKKGAPIYEIDKDSIEYKKKLNVIGRSLKFGINLLLWGKCMFEKVEINNEEELWDLKGKLNEAYKNSHLPEKPDPEPYENYLIKWRLHKLEKDEFI